jgi:adenylylsulfate kinase
MITPFRDSQEQTRDIIEDEGEFVQIYVKCTVDAAEERDPKGLYQQAREGKIQKFTGVNHPFQEPLNPEIVVDTETQSIGECIDHIFTELENLSILDEQLNDEYEFSINRQEEKDIVDRLQQLGYLNE